ncbi:MAG TPA: hypothetical protein VIR63_01890 [Pontiella sp.]
MARKRNYKVRGDYDFLVMAGFCFFLCLWAVKDAWFPGDKVLEKHPRRVPVAFEVKGGGTIQDLHVGVGDVVLPPRDGDKPTLLASLKNYTLQSEFDEIKEAFKALPKDSPEKDGLRKEIVRLKAELDGLKVYCPELGKEKSGKISEILVSKHEFIQAGQSILIIEPKTTFYVFNKSLALGCFLGFFFFLGVYVLGH